MAHEKRRPHTGSRHTGRISSAGTAPRTRGRETVCGGQVPWHEPDIDLPLAQGGVWPRPRSAYAGLAPCHGAPLQTDTHPASPGLSLNQRQRPAPVRAGLRVVDTPDRRQPDRAEVEAQAGRDGAGKTACTPGAESAKALAARLAARPAGHFMFQMACSTALATVRVLYPKCRGPAGFPVSGVHSRALSHNARRSPKEPAGNALRSVRR